MTDDTALKAKIAAAITEQDGHQMLSCHAAFRIAEALDLRLADIGRYCNDNGIKIVHCQLGCFK